MNNIDQEIQAECWEQSALNPNGRLKRWIKSAYADGLSPEDIVAGFIGTPCSLPRDVYEQTLEFVKGVINDA